jgi:hypothetical protein
MGVGLLLLGLWGFRHFRAQLGGVGIDPPRRSVFSKPWLWLAVWASAGLGWLLFGWMQLRYLRGNSQYLAWVVRGPLIDEVIAVLSVVLIFGSWGLVLVWFAVAIILDVPDCNRNSSGQ